MNKYLGLVLCLVSTTITTQLHAQSTRPLGSFDKPASIKRYPIGTPLVLYTGSPSSDHFAMIVGGPALLFILQLDSAFHPRGILEVSLPVNKPVKGLSPTAYYQQADTQYVLLEQGARSPSVANEGPMEDVNFAVLVYHAATQSHRVESLEPLLRQGAPRKVLSAFALHNSFWLLTSEEGQQVIELHRYRGPRHIDTRTFKLPSDLFRDYTRPRLDRREEGMDLWLTSSSLQHVPIQAYDFQLMVLDDELILTRSILKSTEQAIPLLRFGVTSPEARLQYLQIDRGQSPNSVNYITCYKSQLVLTQLSQQKLRIELRSFDAPETVIKQRVFDANDSLVRRLKIHASVGGRSPIVPIPFYKSKNPFFAVGNLISPSLLFSSHYSSYGFTGSSGELVMGFTAQWANPNVTANQSAYSGSAEFSSIALRLDSQTLELLDPPSGPLLSQLKTLDVAQERLTRSNSLRIKARRLMEDGSMIVLAQDVSTDMVGVFRIKP